MSGPLALGSVPFLVSVAASIVFLVVIALIVRELRRPKPDPRPGAAPRRPPSERPPEGPDVTMVFREPLPADARPPSLAMPDGNDQDPIEQSESRVFFGSGLDASLADADHIESKLSISAEAHTDTGRRKKQNEDAFRISSETMLFTIADGMGGYAGGDIASHLAVDVVTSYTNDRSLSIEPSPKRPSLANRLVRSIEMANSRIFAEAQRDPSYEGMGTTVIAAQFSPDTSRLYVAYVGDSRCYRWRAGELTLLTVDHTLGMKGVSGPMSEYLHRAVGVRSSVKVDLLIDAPRAGDRYLLCSDGLPKMVPDDGIAHVLASGSSIKSMTRRLVDTANAKGGRDNITVILIGVDEPSDRRGFRRWFGGRGSGLVDTAISIPICTELPPPASPSSQTPTGRPR